MAVDWSFIRELEGCTLHGYVPRPDISHSGVTVASGVDLGQVTAADIQRWPIDAALRQKLAPYAGYKKEAAVAYLQAHPLAISEAECDQLNAAVHGQTLARLRAAYDVAAAPATFDGLPERMQTVIASVAFQYGTLSVACPKFWRLAVARDWPGLSAELQNFGDRYSTRHRREAAYLNGAPATAVV